MYAVISECAGSETDNIEWKNYIAERKYQEKSIRKLSEKIPVMFPKMKELAELIIKFNVTQAIEKSIQMTKEEMIDKEIENVAKYGTLYLRRYINMLNSEVDYEYYLQMREEYKHESHAEILYCFNYENHQYVVDWYRLLWFVFIGHNGGCHDADIIVLELIEYGKSRPDVTKGILDAVKKICLDERLEKNRWISNYHWLLLLIYSFEGIEDSIIRDAFMQREEYIWESSLALLAIYSGDLHDLNIKRKNDKPQEVVTHIDCEDKLLELAKESEIISKQLDNTMQILVQEKYNISTAYIEKLIGLGENGALIAGVLCYCYGLPIHMESGMVAHQTYFLRSKVDSNMFLKLLRLTRTAFNTQLDDDSKLEEYKAYLADLEAHLDEVHIAYNRGIGTRIERGYGELMEYINGYKAEESLYTMDGKEISVLRLEVENEEKVLDEWATHFREQYRYMEDLDFERHGTRRTRQEHLRDYVFPSDSVRPGPSTRVGDFCEILVADYIEFVCNYYVPRIRYRDKFNRNTSPQGSDVLGFKMGKKASTKDEALVFEVKGTSSPTGNPKGYKRLQDAIDDSSKDLLRYSETLNATKMRLYRMGRTEEAERIERFQNKTDIPRKRCYSNTTYGLRIEGTLYSALALYITVLIRACQEQAKFSACKTSFKFFIRAVVLRT